MQKDECRSLNNVCCWGRCTPFWTLWEEAQILVYVFTSVCDPLAHVLTCLSLLYHHKAYFAILMDAAANNKGLCNRRVYIYNLIKIQDNGINPGITNHFSHTETTWVYSWNIMSIQRMNFPCQPRKWS